MQAMVIDDCDVTRLLLARMLDRLGYEVIEATNGKEALDLLTGERKPRIIFVDWSMPEMDGLSFIRAVRAANQYQDVPILMVTTETEMRHVAQALTAGANEYVMKPFTKQVILEKLSLLGLSQTES